MKKLLSFLAICLISQISLFAQSDVVITEISYNPITPNGGPEYIEILNNGTTNIQMEGINFRGVSRTSIRYTFPNFILKAGEYVLITNDSIEFRKVWGKTAFEYTGFVLNGGLNLQLQDTSGMIVDSVNYDNVAPWPLTGAGEGSSIELCDPNTDNSQFYNWQRSTVYSGQIYQQRKMYGSPGVANSCQTSPIFHMRYRTFEVDENDGNVDLDVFLENSSGSASSVEVKAIGVTGDISTDITFTSPTTVSFSGNNDEMLNFSFTVVDDTLPENDETILFVFQNPSNGVFANDSVMVTIRKDVNDNLVSKQLKLAGIMNVGEQNPAPNLIEIIAVSDIPDLSIYSIGCANNGGGTDGIEFTFPAVAAKKGKSYFITRQPDDFKTFFGFDADFLDTLAGGGTTTATNFTGDDALELFENGKVIDRYGLPDVDGTGEIWEYLDSWAKRKEKTGPDGDNFVAANWTYGGNKAVEGATKNDSATNPYPLPKEPAVSVFGPKTINGNIVSYPNPTSNEVTISGFETAQSIVLMNALGKVLETKVNVIEESKFDMSNLNSGIYFIRINSNEGSSQVLRIVKE